HQQLAKGHLEFTLAGSKLKGRWHLVRMKGRDTGPKQNWLLIKVEDEFARDDDGSELLEERPRSVKTRRTVEDVAKTAVKIRPKRSEVISRAEQPKHEPPPPAKGSAAIPSASGIKGARRGPLPGFVEPQLASLAGKPPIGE